MPSKSPAQAKLMRAVAHGWKPDRIEGPPVSVAKEFVEADQMYSGGFAENRYQAGGQVVGDRLTRDFYQHLTPAVGMYEGGLAPMNDIIQRMEAPGLNMQEGGDVWTPWGEGQDIGDVPDDALAILDWDLSKGSGVYVKMMRKLQAQIRDKYGVPDPATGEPTAMAPPNVPTTYGPRGGPRRHRNGGGRDGRRNGGGGGPGGRPPGPGPGPGPGGPPPTVVPPTVVPPTVIPPRDPRAGRDTAYSEALRAHRERVAASLAVPEGGYAEGGHVENYQEGGAARAGHAEGPNPYDKGKMPNAWNSWERKHHKAPAPPPPPPPEPEELGWLDRLMGKEKERQTRTERELEEMEEAYGGYIQDYQFGGLAQANFRRPPMGGVPPRTGGGYGATTQPVGPIDQGGVPWRGAPPPRIMPGGGGGMPPLPPGKGPRRMVPPSMPPGGGFPGRRFPGRGFPGRGGRPGGANPYMPDGGGRMPFGGRDPRAMPPQGGGVPGGPNVQPNMRGMLQKMRMMNRPPANVGGGANRVGMQDQQGGLARALQRGTGRPPMSRRGGFPGRNVR